MEPIRAFTVTSRLLPSKSISAMICCPSSFRAVTETTFSFSFTLISTLGFTSRDTLATAVFSNRHSPTADTPPTISSSAAAIPAARRRRFLFRRGFMLTTFPVCLRQSESTLSKISGVRPSKACFTFRSSSRSSMFKRSPSPKSTLISSRHGCISKLLWTGAAPESLRSLCA